jgi:hypothetical protein
MSVNAASKPLVNCGNRATNSPFGPVVEKPQSASTEPFRLSELNQKNRRKSVTYGGYYKYGSGGRRFAEVEDAEEARLA